MAAATYRWVIVATGGLLGCVAAGALFCLPVFLRAIAREPAGRSPPSRAP